MLDKLLKHSLFRYVIVGGVAYLVDIGVLIGCYYGLNMPKAVAAGISFWAGLLVSFTLQKLIAFQDYKKEVKAISRQAVWYAVLVSFNYVFTIALVSFFPGKDIVLSKTLAVAISTIWNYIIYKRIIFKKDKTIDDRSES